MTPEEQAREIIDQKLSAAGWVVQDFKQLNLGAGLGVAVRIVEAKKAGTTLSGVFEQLVLKRAFEGKLVGWEPDALPQEILHG